MPERAEPARSEPALVVLCGGTESHRQTAQRENLELIDQSVPVAVGDAESLLRHAPRSRAVIVCGELAGISANTVERLIRQHAPRAALIRADRATEQSAAARRPRRRTSFAGRAARAR